MSQVGGMTSEERKEAQIICINIQKQIKRLSYLTRNHRACNYVDAQLNDFAAIETDIISGQGVRCEQLAR